MTKMLEYGVSLQVNEAITEQDQLKKMSCAVMFLLATRNCFSQVTNYSLMINVEYSVPDFRKSLRM